MTTLTHPLERTMNALAQPNYLTNAQGERIAVQLPLELYEQMLDALEELEDLADIAAREEEPTIPHEQVIAELKANGRL